MSAVTRATTPPRTSGLKRHQFDIDGMHWHGFVTPGQKGSTKRLDDEVSTALPSQCTSVGLFDSLPTTPACDYALQAAQTSAAPSWEPPAPVWKPSGAFGVDAWCDFGVGLEALKALLNDIEDVQQPPVPRKPQSPIKEEELDEPLTPQSMAKSQNAVFAPFSTPPATPRNKSTECSMITPSGMQLSLPPSTPRNKSTEHSDVPSFPVALEESPCTPLLTARTLMQHSLDMEELQRPMPSFPLSVWEAPHLPLDAPRQNCLGKELDELLTQWPQGMESKQFETPSLLAPAGVSACPMAPGGSPYPPLLMALMQNRLDMVQSVMALDPEAARFPFWDHGVEPPVCAALRFGCSVGILEALIKSGASVNATDSSGQSPLQVLRSTASFSPIMVAQMEELLVGASAEPLKEEAEQPAGKEDAIGWCLQFHEGMFVAPLLTNFQLPPPPSLDLEDLQRPVNHEELRPTYATQELVHATFSSPPSTPRKQSTEQTGVPSCPLSAWEAPHLPLEAPRQNCLGKELDELLTQWPRGMESKQFETPSLLAPAGVSTCPMAPGGSPYPPLLAALIQNRLDMVQSVMALDPEAAHFPFWDHGVEPPICAALRFGCSVGILEALIKSGASVNATDSSGQSPLQVLSSTAGFSMIIAAQIQELLVGAGAEPLKDEAEAPAGKLEDTIGWYFPFNAEMFVDPRLTNFQLPPPPGLNL